MKNDTMHTQLHAHNLLECCAVVEFSVYNVGYMRYCLRSGIGKKLEGDGADSCIDNKEVRHGSTRGAEGIMKRLLFSLFCGEELPSF